MTEKVDKKAIAAVTVAALGYFVDIYDLLLFSIVRIQSLSSLGLQGDELLSKGVLLLNMQMAGMLLGGLVWGMMGDRRGRLSVLFLSILVYSVANIANAYVQSIEQYALVRFIAGFGLAGELGVGITLVGESLPTRLRGYGTTIVASVGVAGAVVASHIGSIYEWRTCYLIGGWLGVALLLLRIGVYESGVYEKMDHSVTKGSILHLIGTAERAKRFVCSVLSGVTVWFLVGILITFSPEFGRAFSMAELPVAGTAVMWCYAGLVVGDVASGLLSQLLKSRKRVMYIFLALQAMAVGIYVSMYNPTLQFFYAVCGLLGFSGGFWAVFITMASEQFGTNLRATVTTSAPNFVRGSLIPITWAFEQLRPNIGMINAALVVFVATAALSIVSLLSLKETFSTDLNYVE